MRDNARNGSKLVYQGGIAHWMLFKCKEFHSEPFIRSVFRCFSKMEIKVLSVCLSYVFALLYSHLVSNESL